MKRHRHTLERRNAPYRGASTQEDFVLPYTKAVRDLTRLLYLAGKEGHRKQTDGLLDRMIAGRDGELRNSVFPAGKMVKVEREEWGQDPSEWESIGGAVVSSSGRGYILSEEGLLDPAGIRLRVPVSPGDVIWLSFFIRPVSGALEDVSFGAVRINNGAKEMQNIGLSTQTDGVWVDKRLYCDEREEAELAILLHDQPAILSAGACYIESLEWGFVVETETELLGYDHVKDVESRKMKRRIDAIERGGR